MQLANKTNCTGCTACVISCPQKCLQLKNDKFGFIYPVIEDSQKCIECKKCEKVCPVLNEKNKEQGKTEAYAAYAKDETVRMESSSGGIFTLIAKQVLKLGGSVFGAAYCENFGIHHICVEDESDLSKLRGAKYAQSDLDGCFSDIRYRLLQKQQVLFSGTPCQVAGLKAFLQKEYSNLVTVDFVCHGVPSPLVWKNYVSYRAQKDNFGTMPESINLRSKTTGWSRYKYSNLYQYKSNTYTAFSGEDLYMQLFVGDYINRTSCADCYFKGYDRVSDITLGDFWGIWDIDPAMDDDKGTSLLLIHSEKGKSLFQNITAEIINKQMKLEETSRFNRSMLYSVQYKKEREKVLKLVCKGDFVAAKEILNKRQKCQRIQNFYGRIINKLHRIFKKRS